MGAYGVTVMISTADDDELVIPVIKIKATGSRDEKTIVRAMESYARSIAELRAGKPTSRTQLDLTPWWSK